MICPEMIGSSSPYPYFKSGRVNMLDFGAKRCAAVERRAVESRGDNIGTAFGLSVRYLPLGGSNSLRIGRYPTLSSKFLVKR